MCKVPAALLYLTIYNPTLKTTGNVSEYGEDAEELAHILFFTSREHAVSRDRILRQVGLAKALVNFSDTFNTGDSNYNVHSQTKRMVMINPEPDFWIHAAIELAKSPRPPVANAKSKGKEKQKPKPELVEQQIYDYHDGSLHDIVLCGQIQHAYKFFKLTHGSFTSILSSLGREALELQLERFFSVWAWSWNIDEDEDPSMNIGLPLHPLHRSLAPLLDALYSQIPHHLVPIIICPPYLVPSTQFTYFGFPEALTRYFLTLVTPTPAKSGNGSDLDGCDAPPSIDGNSTATTIHKKSGGYTNSAFRGMPSMNLSLNMDVRKWSWPFAKNAKKSDDDLTSKGRIENDTPTVAISSTGVDSDALDAAMSCDNLELSLDDSKGTADTHSFSRIEVLSANGDDDDDASIRQPSITTNLHDNHSGDVPRFSNPPSDNNSSLHVDDHGSPVSQTSTVGIADSTSPDTIMPEPTPEFSFTSVFLADKQNSAKTCKTEVAYLRRGDLAIAFIGSADVDGGCIYGIDGIAMEVLKLLADVQSIVDDGDIPCANEVQSSTNTVV